MKKLRVLVPFRDESNFFCIHQMGDTIDVTDSRAARLIELNVCKEVEVNTPKPEISDSSVSEEPTAAVVEKPKRAYNRKKKEA